MKLASNQVLISNIFDRNIFTAEVYFQFPLQTIYLMSATLHHFNFQCSLRLAVYLDMYEFLYFSWLYKKISTFGVYQQSLYFDVW